jgi:hypothetical protein
MEYRARNGIISGDLLREKALIIASHLDPQRQFGASKGFLQNFQKKYHISSKMLSGESRSVPPEVVTAWTARIPEIIERYGLDCIYNCDETGIFYRSLPERTLAGPKDDCKNAKSSKERFTALFTVSATGEKLRPLVIGKSKMPQSFKKKYPEGVKYYYNKTAWMTWYFPRIFG